ncbi:MAG: hypothetical protein ACLQDY_19255 [Streptosporangiaceae bacterium]
MLALDAGYANAAVDHHPLPPARQIYLPRGFTPISQVSASREYWLWPI